jgi:LPS sulfotransferase NodH
MEIFNPELVGDAPYVAWRAQALAELYGPQASYLDAQGYLDGERFDLTRLATRFFQDFDGTKVMYDQVARSPAVWQNLVAMPDLRVLVLRRNIIEAAVSFKIALETHVWHVASGAAGHAPAPITFDLSYFAWFYDHFCASEAAVVAHFQPRQCRALDYATLVTDWTGIMAGVYAHLGLEPQIAAMPFRKGVERGVIEMVANFTEIRAHYAGHPVLAKEFDKLVRA